MGWITLNISRLSYFYIYSNSHIEDVTYESISDSVDTRSSFNFQQVWGLPSVNYPSPLQTPIMDA